MRILVISNMYPSNQAPTFGIFVKNQVEALMNKGNQVDVAAITNPNMGKKNVAKKYSSWIYSTFRRLVSAGKSYDVVHAHYAFPSGLLARWFHKRFGTPYIVTCHGGDLNKMAKKGRFFHNQTKKILKDAAHVIVVGHDLEKQVMDDFQIPSDKVSVFSMGVDRKVFYPRPMTDIHKKWDISPYEKHLLFVGNIIEEKGIGDLIEALPKVKQRFPTMRLHVVGPAKQESYLETLKERLQTLGLSEQVDFHGPKSQNEVAEWMAAADVFILPSHIEGFGLVALEAMACHTAVVGTKTGGLAHLLDDGAGVLTEPQQPDSLADNIVYVLNHDDERKQLVEKAQEKVDENDADKMTDKVLAIYEDAQ
ncbi:glycosyltransferase involved in cell wall biosynthesis [Salibacterium salarium]|uniref:glycosyltransferase n=1 Tax=Salibacterium salarium TaxID=284579 RepID=UPI002780E941|nr:glycosyltransferase [Salibacterium salarium]MDQ0298194.1 glycosyltransferase involved in cell wall biosynthesis [Salibacterium salarium]